MVTATQYLTLKEIHKQVEHIKQKPKEEQPKLLDDLVVPESLIYDMEEDHLLKNLVMAGFTTIINQNQKLLEQNQKLLKDQALMKEDLKRLTDELGAYSRRNLLNNKG